MAAADVPIYVPQAPPLVQDAELQGTSSWAYLELQKIARLFGGSPWEQLNVLSAPPGTPRPGMIAYADGLHWNPPGGSGEGLYVFKSTGGWHFIV